LKSVHDEFAKSFVFNVFIRVRRECGIELFEYAGEYATPDEAHAGYAKFNSRRS
jgi:hypothetical protein